jgi:2-methylcitrate dehydratase PrpD
MNAVAALADQDLTRALVRQAIALRHADIPEDIRAWARQCVLDYVACALAGAKDELTEILLAEMTEQGGNPGATVMGHRARLPAPAAAIVNGAASHALDYDDVNLAMPGHPSVAILPGLLALAEERGASGAAVLTAFVAGYELQCRVGRVIAPGHYDGLGFHATATVGSFGAAAACAHLLELDEDRFAMALGIAGTQAAGLKSMFGTMCKPLHAGKASYHGLMAAKLAARGFTARSDVLECAQGFARTHSPDFKPERALETPPQGWHIRNNLFKYHAACYMVHAPIEAARKLRERHGVAAERVARVRLRVDAASDRICNIQAPVTGLEAKFSLKLATAMGLSGVDTGRLDTYSEAVATDAALVAMRDRVEIDFRSDLSNTFAAVELTLTDGSTLTAEHDAGVPATDTDEQGRRLAEKFMALVAPILGDNAASALIGDIAHFDSLPDASALLARCGG